MGGPNSPNVDNNDDDEHASSINDEEEDEEDLDDDDDVEEEEEIDNDDDDDEEQEQEQDEVDNDESDASNQTDDGSSNDDDDDDDDDQSQSSGSEDSDNDSGSDNEDEGGERAGDGLSEYERLRLERIKRNEERLAKLGLHSKDGGGVLGQKPKQQRKKKAEREQVPIERRERLARSTKEKKVDYAKDFDFKISSLPNRGRLPDPNKEKKKSNPPSKNDFQHRVPLFIYQEFQRIRARRKQNLKHAKQAAKQAQKELKHWKRQVEIVIKRKLLKQEREKAKLEKQRNRELNMNRLERERRTLGGKTKREILNEIDERSHELTQLVNSYDTDNKLVTDFRSDKDRKQALERKMLMVDSLDRFPRAVNEALSTLNALLLGRSPKNPIPVRRSKRTIEEQSPPVDHSASSSPSKKRMKISLKNGKSTAQAVTPSPSNEVDDGGSSAWTHLASTMASNNSFNKKPASAPSTSKLAVADTSKKDKQKRIKEPRLVGGWISPAFSKELDRSWLEREKPLRPVLPPPGVPKPASNKVFDLKSYVPQIGDIVLYYPSAHRDYLRVYPDYLNQKQLKNHLRYPLWIRGKREMNRLIAGSLTLNDLPDLWWTDDWLNDLNDNFGKKKKGPSVSDYPIVCRVERVHTEFPHDPYGGHKRVVKTDQGTIIDYSGAATGLVPRSKKKSPKTAHSHLCALLAPLTPILPPGVVVEDPYFHTEMSDADPAKDGRAMRKQKSSATSMFSSSTKGLSIPPKLTVVMSPSNTTSVPFVVPLCWTYAIHHSLTVGEPIWTRGSSAATGGRGTITGFKDFGFKKEGTIDEDSPGIFRLDERLDDVKDLLTRLSNGGSFSEAVKNELASCESKIDIPERELSKILEFLSNLIAERQGSILQPPDQMVSNGSSCSGRPVTIEDLILYTLPVRNSICVSLESNHRVTLRTSCWKIWTLQPTDLTRSFQDGALATLDSALREKAEMCIEDFLNTNPNASVFVPEIKEEAVPSYYLAVPVGMHFGRIKARLKADSQGRCYYTSIESLQSDLQAITDNCCLYNAPESEIAILSTDYIVTCKRMLSDIVNHHTRANQKTDLNNPAGVDSTSPKTSGGKKPRIPYDINAPFFAPIDREWLGRTSNDEMNDPTTSTGSWVPQCGDAVLYSRSKHLTFVAAHQDSLSALQQVVPMIEINADDEGDKPFDTYCSNDNVPSDKENKGPTSKLKNQTKSSRSTKESVEEDKKRSALPSRDEIDSSWLEGMIVSVRSTFPRNSRGGSSFGKVMPILAIELNLRYSWSMETVLVCWRPTCEESFLFPSWLSRGIKPILPAGIPLSDVSATLPKATLSMMGHCFDFLKDRVLKGTSPEYISPEEVLSKAEKGEVDEPLNDHLPSFVELVTGQKIASTSKTGRPKKEDLVWKQKLSSMNYLPIWAANALKKAKMEKKTKEQTPRKGDKAKAISSGKRPNVRSAHEVLLPVPTLCLELIRLRISNGYYRHALSVVSDISESYVTSVLYLLHRYAKRKKNPLSIRKIARFLNSPQANGKLSKFSRKNRAFGRVSLSSVDAKASDPMEGFTEEEKQLVSQIQSIRMLHAVAVTCATDTSKIYQLFFSLPKETQDDSDVEEPISASPTISIPTTLNRTPEEIKAVQTIRHLLCAVQRDKKENKSKFAKAGIFKLKIRCDRKLVTENGFVEYLKDGRFMFEPSSTIASLQIPEKKDVRVHIMVGNEPIYGGRKVNMTPTKFILPKGVEGRNHIELDRDDFRSNDDFTKAFFTKEGCRSICVRCQANGLSLFNCRVIKSHSNADFNFEECFKNSGGLNKSLLLPWSKNVSIEDTVGTKNQGANSKDDQQVSDDENDDEDGTLEQGDKEEGSWEDRADDARRQLEKSQRAVEQAGYLLSQAQMMVDQEARLSQEFVDQTFPTDEDGLYTMCSVCGLSGNVICCETCPVVMHPKCVGLSEVPEGDWFCPRCVKEGKSSTDALPPSAFQRDERQVGPIVEQASTTRNLEATILTPFDDVSTPIKLKIRILNAGLAQNTMKKTAPKPELDDEEIEDQQEELDSTLGELIQHREKLGGFEPTKRSTQKKKTADPGGLKVENPTTQRKRNITSDSPIESLPAMGRRFCNGIGITSAEDFLDRPSSELARQFISWRKEVGERPLHGSGPSAYISMFKAQLRQEIEMSERRKERALQSDKGVPPKQKRKRRAAGNDPWVAVAPDPRVSAALNKAPRSPVSMEKHRSDLFGPERSTGAAEERYLRAIQKGGEDPLQNLPQLGRKFLKWAGINDPAELVSTKTSDLAMSFVKYRRAAKMSVLNGSGAAAYCGAWKSQVRKQLALQEEVSTITNEEKEDESTTSSRSKKRKASAVRDVEEVPSPVVKKKEKLSAGQDMATETTSSRGRKRMVTQRLEYS